MSSRYRGAPWIAPKYPNVDLGFDPDNLAQDTTLPPKPGWVAQEQAARAPVQQAGQRLEESMRMQDAAQAPPSGIEGIINSPIFQLAAPTALTALAAMFPRTMGPAAGIGMAGLRGVTDVTKQNIQNKRSTVAERVKQMKADLESQKLGYSIETAGDLDPAKKEAAYALKAAGDLTGAANVVKTGAEEATELARFNQRHENPSELAPGETEQITAPGISVQRTMPQQKMAPTPGEQSFEKMSAADWLSKNPGKGASDYIAWERGLSRQPKPTDPSVEAGIDFVAKSLADMDSDHLVNVSKYIPARGEARVKVVGRAAMLNPDLDLTKVDNMIDMAKSYYNGPMSKQIMSLNTATEHIGGLAQALDNVELLQPIGNKALNTWRLEIQSNPEFAAYLAAMEGPKKEVAKFLLGGQALYEDDRIAFNRIANDKMSAEAMRAVMKEWVHLSAVRASNLNEMYKNAMGKDVPRLYTPGAIEAAKRIGFPLENPRDAAAKKAANPQGTPGPAQSKSGKRMVPDPSSPSGYSYAE